MIFTLLKTRQKLFWGCLRIDLQATQGDPSYKSKLSLKLVLLRWTTHSTQRINFNLFLESKAPNKEKRFDTPEDILENILLGSEKFPELSQQWYHWVNPEDNPEGDHSDLGIRVLVYFLFEIEFC